MFLLNPLTGGEGNHSEARSTRLRGRCPAPHGAGHRWRGGGVVETEIFFRMIDVDFLLDSFLGFPIC